MAGYRRINIYGGPGAGKSNAALEICSALKKQQKSIELIPEFVKDMAYQKYVPQSFDQPWIYMQQLHAEDIKLRYVDYIVTDSPLLMQWIYTKDEFKSEVISLSCKFEKVYPSINFFLKRGDFPYETKGRYQNIDEAREVDRVMLDFLRSCELSNKINLHIVSSVAEILSKL